MLYLLLLLAGSGFGGQSLCADVQPSLLRPSAFQSLAGLCQEQPSHKATLDNVCGRLRCCTSTRMTATKLATWFGESRSSPEARGLIISLFVRKSCCSTQMGAGGKGPSNRRRGGGDGLGFSDLDEWSFGIDDTFVAQQQRVLNQLDRRLDAAADGRILDELGEIGDVLHSIDESEPSGADTDERGPPTKVRVTGGWRLGARGGRSANQDTSVLGERERRETGRLEDMKSSREAGAAGARGRHSRTRTQAHAYAHARTRAHTHAHTHTHCAR